MTLSEWLRTLKTAARALIKPDSQPDPSAAAEPAPPLDDPTSYPDPPTPLPDYGPAWFDGMEFE